MENFVIAFNIYNLLLQALCTVEEDPDGERIEDQLVVLRDQLLQLSPTEQQLHSAPNEQVAVSVDVRPRPTISPATTASIQTALQVINQLDAVFHVGNECPFDVAAMGKHLPENVYRV